MTWEKALDALINLAFPESCPTCGGKPRVHAISPFCETCWEGIDLYKGPACGLCGLPLPSPEAGICSDCMLEPPAFSRLRSFSLYDGVLREAIHEFKYRGRRRLASPLGRLLARIPVDTAGLDAIVPVPVHPVKLRKREFNQAALLARELARHLGVPVLLDGLAKQVDVPPQAGLKRKQRLNIGKRVFGVENSSLVLDKRILLVDDVCTTGATVRACSAALMKAGAWEVRAVALARSSPDVWEAS